MNEMELIEEMCASVPAPDQARLAAIRARVLEEAHQTMKPVLRNHVRSKIRLLTWPRLALTSAVAVAAAFSLILAGVISFGGALSAPANAAELLDRAAVAAQTQPAPTDKQLVYSDTRIYYATYTRNGRPGGHVTVRQQEWQSPITPTAFYRTSPCDVNGDLHRGQATCSFEGGYAPGAQPYATYAGLTTLPTAASKLLAYLATLPAPSGLSKYDREWSGANLIASLNPVLPPRFAAALFRAVAQIPGTVLQRIVKDAAGAHGIGISMSAGGLRSALIFDPTTYKLVGQEYVALARDLGRPAVYVTSATALIASKFVGTHPGIRSGGPSPATNAGPRNDQFIYTDTKIAVLSPVLPGARGVPKFTLLRGSEQVWQSVDGSMPGAFDTAPCHAGRAGCLLLIPPGAAAPALATYAELKRLPTSAGALASYLRHHNPCPATMRAGNQTIEVTQAAREWNALTATLGNVQVMPPKLDKVLFEAAASIPGAVVLRSVTDAAGGRGIAVARNESAALRTELIFAPRSYRFIGVQDVLTKRVLGLRKGAVWAASALISALIVNSAPAAPLAQSYTPQTCGFTPGMIAVSSSSSGTPVTPGSSSGTARSARSRRSSSRS